MRLASTAARLVVLTAMFAGSHVVAGTVTKTEMGPPPFSEQEMEQARTELDERIAACRDERKRPLHYECDAIYAEIFLIEKPGGALGWEAERRFWNKLPRAKRVFALLFDQAAPAEKALILQIIDENWSTLVRGMTAERTRMVVLGLEHDDVRVRNAAANLMATKPLLKIGHAAIDAATFDPELTPAALHALAVNQAHLHAEWIVSQLASDDEKVREAALWAVWRIGSGPTLSYLRKALESDDPILRDSALEAVLRFGSPDSIPWLYEWLEAHPDADPERRDRVIAVLAEIESGLVRTVPPAPPAYEPLPVEKP